MSVLGRGGVDHGLDDQKLVHGVVDEFLAISVGPVFGLLGVIQRGGIEDETLRGR